MRFRKVIILRNGFVMSSVDAGSKRADVRGCTDQSRCCVGNSNRQIILESGKDSNNTGI